MDRAITLVVLLFIGIFSILSLYTFYNQILLNINKITLQLVMVSFAIIGSSLLVILTILLQVNRYYKPLPDLEITPLLNVQEVARVINEKQKKIGESIEIVAKKRGVYEEVLKKYLETRISPEIPIVSSNEYLAQKGISQEKSNQDYIIDTESEQKKDEIQLQGMRMNHVSMLNDLGINTIPDLCRQEPEQLYRKIIEWNRLHNRNYEYIPSRGMIKRWIRLANKKI